MKIPIYLLLFFLNFSKGITQPFNLNFKSLNSRVAITNNISPYVFKDSKGLLWISTSDGINICDGLNIQLYKQEDGIKENDANGFYGNIIQGSFFEDKNTDIWFTTYNGINCYRRHKNSFEHFFLVDEQGNKIKKNYRGYFLDSNLKFWLQSEDEHILFTFDTQTLQQSKTEIVGGAVDIVEHNKSIFVSIIVANKLEIIELSNYKIVKREIILEYKPGNSTLTDVQLFNDNVFVATPDGLFNYDITRKKRKKLLDGYFTSALLYQKTYLFLTSPKGITIYNILNNQAEALLSNGKLGIQTVVSKLYVDNDGGLWATNRYKAADIFYANLKKNPFKVLKLPLDARPFVSVRLFINKENKIFAINKNCDKITILNATDKTIIRTLPLPKYDSNTAYNSILVDSDNTIWFSTKRNLYYYGNKEQKWKEIKLNSIENLIWSIKETKNKRILLCTNDGLYEVRNQKLIKIQIINNSEGSAVDLFEDSRGLIHISIDANDYIITQFKTKDTLEVIKKIMLNGYFSNHYEDDKKIWLGTNLGIASIDKANYSVEFHNQKKQSASQLITDMLSDKAGNLWVATNNGLVAYNTRTKQSRTFDSSTGLFSDAFMVCNSVQTQNNELCFGAVNAVIYFNPDEIKPSEYKSPVHITSFKVNDIEHNRLNTSSLTKITLKYNENSINLQFTAIDFTDPEKTRVAYLLEGWDNQWDTCITANGAIRYSNLLPGRYKLKMASCNADGFWSPEQRTIQIHILPPFYLTWWFLTLCAIAIVLLGYYLNRLQIKKVRIKEREKGELLNRITNSELKALKAQMNPHFVNNCLNSISNFILKNDNDNAFFYLTKFSRMMRMVLDHSDVDFVKLKDEITVLTYYIEMESLRFSSLFTYKIEVDEDIDTELTLVSPMLIQPFVENAIWHGLLPKKEGMVKVHLKKDKNFMQCTIEDNGVGRKKSAESKGSEYKSRKSYGMILIQDRLDILNKTANQHSEPIAIIDVYDDLGNAAGTKIVMKIPTQNKY